MKQFTAVLDTYPSVLVADLVRDRLEAEDIPAFVADEATGSTLAGLESVLGGIRVLVAEADLDRAREVLANLSHPLGTAPEDLSEEEVALLAEAAERAGPAEEPEGDPRSRAALGWALAALLGILALSYLFAKRFGTL